MIKRSALNSAGYRNFVHARNKVLEDLLQKTLLKASDHMRGMFARVLEIVSHRYPQVSLNFFFTNPAASAMKSIEQALDQVFHECALKITQDFMVLKKRSALLAKAGEAEALSRITGKAFRVHMSRGHLDAIASGKTFFDEVPFTRISLSLNRIKRDIIDALELAKTMEEPVEEVISRVIKSLPKGRVIIRPKKVLKEARKITDFPPTDFADLFIDEDEWAAMVEEYKAEFIPEFRSVDDRTLTGDELHSLYPWEGEQQITQDFVDEVRNGENEAAKENGINEFVHIAIVDDRTDECCLWRDGLTISEIEARMDQHPDDECDGTVPPLHANCRCRIVPYSEDIPEAPASNIGDFEAWLLSR